MLAFYLFLLLFFSYLLIKAADILINSLKTLSKTTHLGQFALTSFIMAFATSLPELFVGITAALENKPNLALGNVIGSNIANLSLVIGGTALVGGTMTVVGNELLKKDIFYTFLIGSLPLILLLDGHLSSVDGLVLLLAYFWYLTTVFKFKEREDGWFRGILRRFEKKETSKALSWFFCGMILLIFSSDMIVRISSQIAASFRVPLLLVGLFLVAVGTSLPELSFGIKAIRKQKVAMVFGNLLGSIVANSTLIMGVVSLVSPVKVFYLQEYLRATIVFILVFALFYLFVKSKHKLERWEGGLLFIVYLLFALSEFIQK